MATKLLSNAEQMDDADFVITQTVEDVTAQQNDIDDQLNGIMSEVGSDKNEVLFHFQVWRILKDQADKAFLFKGYISDLPIMERLRDEYDGGKFYVQIYKNKKRYKQVTVSVEAPKKSYVPPVHKNETAEILRAIADQQAAMHKQLVETLMQVAGKPATPQPSQMEMMLSMVTLMKGIKDVTSVPATPPGNDAKDMMDMLIRGMEMGRESGGSGSSMTDVLRDAVKAIPALTQMSAMSVPRATMQNTTAQNPTPQDGTARLRGDNTTTQNTTVEETPVGFSDQMIKQYLGTLIKKAENDSDPTLYADFILDNVPEGIVNQYLMREDLVDELGKLDPRVLQHREWFTELRDHIHEVLTAPDEENNNSPYDSPLSPDHVADDSDGSGGNTSNT